MFEEKRQELIRLLNHGFEFEVKELTLEKREGFFGFLFPRVKKEVVHTFKIKEPTLSVLDRISLESLEFDEKEFNDLLTNPDMKRFSRKHYKTMAKIIAIIVCGVGATTQEINKHSKLFFENLKPSDIYNIVQLSDVVSNMGDFINSTRLLSAANVLNERKPIADLVEEATD